MKNLVYIQMKLSNGLNVQTKIITHHIRKLGSHQLELCFGINAKL